MDNRRLVVNVPVRDFEWVDVPTLYGTPIGDFSDLTHVKQIGYLIEYLQKLPEIEWIINSNHQHVRHPYCRELVRQRLDFLDENLIWFYGEALSHFLMRFGEMTGLCFSDYKYEYRVISNGKKVRIKGIQKLFDTEDEMYRHQIRIHLSKDFDFSIE